MSKNNHCTWFPERWAKWVKWYKWELFPIGDLCCKIHDENCSTTKFNKCLRENKAVGGLLITLGGLIGCMVRYPLLMIKKVL